MDLVRHNLGRMRELLHGDLQRWRPHVKTAKVPEVLRLLLEAGVRKFKVATTRELEVLLSLAQQPVDVLIAMAQHGANLDRSAALARANPRHRLSMLSEDPEHARAVRARGLRVFVDLDPGYHRTGVPLADDARAAKVIEAAGEDLAGLHFYDGHLHDLPPVQRNAASR